MGLMDYFYSMLLFLEILSLYAKKREAWTFHKTSFVLHNIQYTVIEVSK